MMIADELMLKRQHQAWTTVNVCDGDVYRSTTINNFIFILSRLRYRVVVHVC